MAAPQPLQIPLDAPIQMMMHPPEVRRAHAIKAAVEAEEDLIKLTDFEYMQYATAHPTVDMATILHHISRMQAFKDEYGVQDTVEEGVAEITGLSLHQPGYFLSTEYLGKDCNCVAVEDSAALSPQRAQTSEQFANFIKASYYRFQALHPTAVAIQNGFVMLVECRGASSSLFHPEFFQRLMDELVLSYPKKEKDIFLINSPSVINVLVSLWRRFMGARARRAFRLGLQLPGMEDVRLDQLYATPTLEVARQRMIRNTQQLLQVRYHQQATFELPPIDEPPLTTLIKLIIKRYGINQIRRMIDDS